MKNFLTFIILTLSVVSFGQTYSGTENNKEGLLLSYYTLDYKYATLFLTFNNDEVKVNCHYPFIIIPEKLNDKKNNLKPTGKLFYLQVDTLEYGQNEKNYGLILFSNLDSILIFKDTFCCYYNKEPTEADTKIELEKERVKNNWDEATFNEELETALLELNTYNNSGIEINYIFYPYITLRYAQSGSGGAHPNWSEKFITANIHDLFFKEGRPGAIRFKEDNDNDFNEEGRNDNSGCCTINDSLFDLLKQEAIKGNFIDYMGDVNDTLSPDSTYFISDDVSNAYSIIERVDGEPHCLLRADASADYMHSGDYALTVQLDMGIIDKHYKKNSKYQISNFNGKYGIFIEGNSLRVFNRSDKLIYEYKLPFTLNMVISEEWSSGKSLLYWEKALKQ